jgi:hypothetical protein
MQRFLPLAGLACAGLLAAHVPAQAHAIAGARIFPVTLTLDDPGVADEATLPQISYQRSGANGGPGPVQEVDLGFEYDKRITQDFGLVINDSVNIQNTEHDKTRVGTDDIVVTAKYQLLINPPHELIVSVGVIREFGRTGTAHTGADQYGSTAPTLYFGKGLGDLPVESLRPFAVTGELSYVLADRELKALPGQTGTFNNGYANSWSGGMSFQYSIPYLVSQIRDFQAPAFVKHLVPLVEVTWTSPAASPSDSPTQVTVAPGFIWIDRSMQFGLEALIPANKAAGTNVGFVAQFHLFLDDLLPHSLGRPIFE